MGRSNRTTSNFINTINANSDDINYNNHDSSQNLNRQKYSLQNQIIDVDINNSEKKDNNLLDEILCNNIIELGDNPNRKIGITPQISIPYKFIDLTRNEEHSNCD